MKKYFSLLATILLVGVTDQANAILPSQFSTTNSLSTNDLIGVSVKDATTPTGYKSRNVTFGAMRSLLGVGDTNSAGSGIDPFWHGTNNPAAIKILTNGSAFQLYPTNTNGSARFEMWQTNYTATTNRLAFSIASTGASTKTTTFNAVDSAGAENTLLTLKYGSLYDGRVYLAKSATPAMGVGASYSTVTAPANGAIIQGRLGVGNTNPAYTLDVTGTVNSHSGYRLDNPNDSSQHLLFDFSLWPQILSVTTNGNPGIQSLNTTDNGLTVTTNFVCDGAGNMIVPTSYQVGTAKIFSGTGVPTNSAPKGSLWLRTDGANGNQVFYVNTNGTTGWIAK